MAFPCAEREFREFPTRQVAGSRRVSQAALGEGFVASRVIAGDHFRYSVRDDAIFRAAQTQHRALKLPTGYSSGTK
jgi:hypothetical protein